MRILLTGSTGFIGSHLKVRLERDGHEVTCLLRNQYPHSFDGYELIVNVAGELDDLAHMFNTNVYLTHGLLLNAQRNGSRMIQIGSSSETGPVEGPRSETTFCQPTNLYEATKLAATNLCLGYAAQFGLNVCVARPFTVYGSNDKARKMLPTLWRAFCEHKSFQCAPAGHDWIHVDDFVEGIVALIRAPAEKTKGQIYHFGTGISTSNKEVVELFERQVGSKLTVEWSNARLRPWDVNDWRADWSKAKRELSWEPKVTLQQGIERFISEEWFKQ